MSFLSAFVDRRSSIQALEICWVCLETSVYSGYKPRICSKNLSWGTLQILCLHTVALDPLVPAFHLMDADGKKKPTWNSLGGAFRSLPTRDLPATNPGFTSVNSVNRDFCEATLVSKTTPVFSQAVTNP